MTDFIAAWQCIGCGKIEVPQTCVGICENERAELVYGSEHRRVLALLEHARGQRQALEAIVRRLAHATPHDGEWEHSWRALQDDARRTLAALEQG
jgi:hypothetical protein